MQYSKKTLHSPGVLVVWKNRTETLATLIERVRVEQGISIKVPITYAGRLDPMAEGLVVLLTGQARFDKEHFLKLDKEYTFEVLFGISTDTGDVLGKITDVSMQAITKEQVEAVLEDVKNTQLPYPAFSSKPINGEPLFVHAKQGTLPDVLPMQSGVVRSITCVEIRIQNLERLINTIISDIEQVVGNFRQHEIVAQWKDVQNRYPNISVTSAILQVSVSSGLYVRSVAEAIGKSVGVPALAYSIIRTKIGDVSDPR